MARTGVIGQNIVVGIKFYENGTLFDPYEVRDVNIFPSEFGGTALSTISAVRVSQGFYQATWPADDSLLPGKYYDQWEWVAEEGISSHIQRYSFTVTEPGATPRVTASTAASTPAYCRPKPSWLHLQGLRRTEDVGNGMGIRLTWGEATPDDPNKQVHYNVYSSATRFGILDNNPIAITTSRQVIFNAPPGKLRYFLIRAVEFDPTEYNIAEMGQVSDELYQYPADLTLNNYIDAYGATLEVDSTADFPEKGFIKVNSEVLQYTSRGPTYFEVEYDERGAFSTNIYTHDVGSTVELFRGIEDGNSLILSETPAWHLSNGTPRNVDEIGEFNVDEDGYRAANTNDITPDFTISDEENSDFPAYDFKGYHRPSIQDTLSGDCVNSYVGGEFNGKRGFNFQERNLARLDAQLQVTGEPIVLLKRKWTGKRCACVGLRREHPKTRCPFCYGTGFAGGYDRYINGRPISERYSNDNKMILVRTHPYTDDLVIDEGGLTNPSELTAWTITVPTLKDRDMLIRYVRNPDTGVFTEEFRYECLNVTRNMLLMGDSGRQQFVMRRMDKTDIIMTYSVVLQP